jgi:mRNA degradation ribonuclease J1/J2
MRPPIIGLSVSSTGDASCRDMRFRIHRGATEIGGNCVELEAHGYTILIDLGLPLSASCSGAERRGEGRSSRHHPQSQP